MLLGKYFISNHAIKQYDSRVNYKGETISAIKKDLRTLNIRHIVRKGSNIHVFTKNSKEFIFVQAKRALCLKTVIKRNPIDTKYVIKKRKSLVFK